MQTPPRHVAIIMDGNGRWAAERGLPRWRGHAAGAGAVRRVTEAACELGIRYLTLFAFSSENWKRPAEEVGFLFRQLARHLVDEREELVRNEIRLSVIGHYNHRMARNYVPEADAGGTLNPVLGNYTCVYNSAWQRLWRQIAGQFRAIGVSGINCDGHGAAADLRKDGPHSPAWQRRHRLADPAPGAARSGFQTSYNQRNL